MVREVSSRLLGNRFNQLWAKEEMLVWAEAASFLGRRIQGSSEECEGRKADMSGAAAQALRTMLGQMEAALKLSSNRERVVLDIVNPGPNNIEGKTLTQTGLKRVDSKYKSCVDDMVKAVGHRLCGAGVAGPLNP